MDSQDGLDKLLKAVSEQNSIQQHPDWPKFLEMKVPPVVSFYYTNEAGDEAYWDSAPIIKVDIKKMMLIIEGTHGDPLRFDIFKIQHCKNAQTGEKVQDIFFELIRMWQETYEGADGE